MEEEGGAPVPVADQWAAKAAPAVRTAEEIAADRKRREEERKAKKKAAFVQPFKTVKEKISHATTDEKDRRRKEEGTSAQSYEDFREQVLFFFFGSFCRK